MIKRLLPSDPLSAITKTRSRALLTRLMFVGAFLLTLPYMGRAQSPPTFLGGTPQSFSVCKNGPAHDISGMFTIIDPDAGDIETWSVLLPAAHGALGGFPATATSTGSITTVSPLSYTPDPGYSGLDSFVIKVDDGTGDSDVTTVYVTINPPPAVAPITGPNSVCVGGTITLDDATPGGTWDVTNSNASIAAGVLTGLAAGLDTATYSVTDVCGTTTVIYEVAITLLPVVAPISGPANVCPGSVITLTDGTTGGTWTASNGNATVDPVTGDVTGMSPGMDTIMYAVTLPCGTTTVTYNVTVDPSAPPVGPISGPTSVCVASTITLTDPTPGGFWNRQNTTAAIDAYGVVTGLTAGVDTIVYKVVNSCGANQVQYTVTVNPLPAAGFITGLTEVCELSGTITLSDASPGGFWSVLNPNASITSSGVLTGLHPGLDTVKYSVTNMCGTAIAIYPVTINPLPVAGAISGVSSVCVASSITLSNFTAAGAGVWSLANGTATIGSASGVVTGVTAGFNTATFTYTNGCGTASTTFALTVNPLPYASIIGGARAVCAHDTIHLSDSVAGGVWSTTAANATIGTTTGIVTGLSAGLASFTYTYTNFCGTVFVTRLDTIRALPDSGVISGAGKLCAGTTISLTDTSHGGIWSASNGSATVSSSGVVTGVAGGTVLISYTVTNVCRSATTTHQVTVNTIPSAGTITGDTAICPDVLVHLMNPVHGGVWTISNSNLLIDDSGVVSSGHPGTWDTVTFTITNECGMATTSFVVHVLENAICWHTAVPGVAGIQGGYNIYPNPANDEIIITTDNKAYRTYTITNLLGQVIMTQPLNSQETQVNVSSLAPGLYNITLLGDNGMVTAKMIKQ